MPAIGCCACLRNVSMAFAIARFQMALLLKILLFWSVFKASEGYHGDLKYSFMRPATSLAYTPLNRTYDYIIVGGGTAGCPLAATLSRNFSVLLLERGGSPYGDLNVSRMENFHICLTNTVPRAPAEVFVSTDGVINSRARVLGGGSSINAGFYTRASPNYVKRAGWDGALVNESYPWIERQIVYQPKLAPWQAAVRDGLLEAGVSPFNGFTFDHVFGTKVGGTIFDRQGFRHTAADLLQSADPENVEVIIRATVQKVLFRSHIGKKKKPRAVGVIFRDEEAREYEVQAKEEVIVTAGAIGSPQLLMLSGIGPERELKKWKIPVVLKQEQVGQGMSDNPMNAIYIPTKKPVVQSLIQTVGITKLGSFVEASSGFGGTENSIHCHHGILSAEIGQLSTIPPKKRSLDAIEEYRRNKRDFPKETFMGGFLLEKIVGPLSKGHLSLNGTDVDKLPAVTFNYFQHPRDLQRCVNGIRTIERIVKSKRFADFTQDNEYTIQMILNMSVKANINFIPKNTNDTTSLEQFCRDTVLTIWHYHGGCQMNKVVDKNYRVMGVEGLRVVDGSTFHSSPGTNPQATVMMLGRYVGVKMLRERLGGSAGV
ncbi:protein HOTHEAD-like isoform X2 [Nymphaea colorata]|uniref:protein HOTHEAD-like isoform X2 n=1 Tax=Nymphaea colorata TaxID=210225 RepID=UPI00129DB6B1|nr:protein HOTHEAD-like isoform X2 [Nymphaea colorata]